MELNLLDFIQHILNIVLLFIILRAILYNPIRKFMKKRNESQVEKQTQIDNALAEAKTAAEENKRKLSEINEQTRIMLDEKKLYAEKIAAETIENAKIQAAKIVEEAEKNTEADKEKAREEAINQTAELAVELAKQILEREVSVEDNKRLIDDFFRKVG